jgi:hypothetical protein
MSMSVTTTGLWMNTVLAETAYRRGSARAQAVAAGTQIETHDRVENDTMTSTSQCLIALTSEDVLSEWTHATPG